MSLCCISTGDGALALTSKATDEDKLDASFDLPPVGDLVDVKCKLGWLICMGCVGRSGLSGSKVKPHFHASLIFSDPLQPTPTHSDPLHVWVPWVGVTCMGQSGS